MSDEDWRAGGFGIYLHWPFCEAKCPYCDFNSFAQKSVDHSAWANAYLRELDRYAALIPGRVLNSVFFGGGTPSLMEPDSVAAIMARIKDHWPLANDLEVTLEANPTSVEAGRFRAFSDAGINRISMGVQALNDNDLRRLGRLHTASEAVQAFDIARNIFDHVSFDLIYARQNQTVAEWRAELSEALSMAVDHLSLYQLTIEPGTVFGARHAQGKLPGLPSDDHSADMYDMTQELCDTAGYETYEVSNHAKRGASSHHNLIYWRYGDFAGIGPGAHGRITLNGERYATETVTHPDSWLNAVETEKTEKARTAINAVEQAQEYLMMSLRLAEGMSLSRYSRLASCDLSSNAIDRLIELEMIEVTGDRLSITRQGRCVLNAITSDLLTAPETVRSPSGLTSEADTDHQADRNSYTI